MKSPEIAILFTGRSPTTLGQPDEMLPLLGRSLLQRAMDALARACVKEIHVLLLGEDPLPTRAFIDDGSRWGCRVVYHHPRVDDTLAALARRLGLEADRQAILAYASCQPVNLDSLLATPLPATVPGEFWPGRRDTRVEWTGWGRFTGAWLQGRHEGLARDEIGAALSACPEVVSADPVEMLSVMMPREILAGALRLLEDAAQPVTMGPGCKIHPTAVLKGPVHLGRNVQVGPGTQVGPCAVIGDGVLLEREVSVDNALVLPDTFVGEGVELRDAIAAGRFLVNTRLGTRVEIPDPVLLSALSPVSTVGAPPWRERALAAALYLLLSPLRLGRRRHGFVACRAVDGGTGLVDLPLAMRDPDSARQAGKRHALLRHFRDSFVPGLGDVAAGRLRLNGPTPRPREAVADLPEVWQAIYARTRPGLLNEGLLQGDIDVPELEMASDSVAAASQDEPPAVRRLLAGYLGAVTRQAFKGWTRPRSPQYANGR